MTRGDAADLRFRYETGATLEELAADTGHSYRCVRETLLAARVTLRPARRHVPPCPPGMVAMYENGASIRQVAQRYRLSYNRARNLLLYAGVILRPQGQARGGRWAPFCEEQKSVQTSSRLRRELGYPRCPTEFIWCNLRKYTISKTTRKKPTGNHFDHPTRPQPAFESENSHCSVNQSPMDFHANSSRHATSPLLQANSASTTFARESVCVW